MHALLNLIIEFYSPERGSVCTTATRCVPLTRQYIKFSVILAKRILISSDKVGKLSKGRVPITKIQGQEAAAVGRSTSRLPATAVKLFITVHLQITP